MDCRTKENRDKCVKNMAEENILTKTNYYNTMVMQLMMEENRRVQYIFLFFTQKETA